MGYCVLPDIHWRKQSNAPNKFMGSGMFPAGAYVTYEHEYILVFRKGGKRVFKGAEKALRQKSAFFWEERNVWFSDLWDIKGTSQIITAAKASRDRSAAFPFEIPYRLINMYSAEGDTVLDPFAGLGTTTLAAIASNRNSLGVEIDEDIAALAIENISGTVSGLNQVTFLNGVQTTYASGEVEFNTNPDSENPWPIEAAAFAEEVNALLSRSKLLISTLDGELHQYGDTDIVWNCKSPLSGDNSQAVSYQQITNAVCSLTQRPKQKLR